MGPLLKELTDLGVLQPKLLTRRREQFEREGHICGWRQIVLAERSNDERRVGRRVFLRPHAPSEGVVFGVVEPIEQILKNDEGNGRFGPDKERGTGRDCDVRWSRSFLLTCDTQFLLESCQPFC